MVTAIFGGLGLIIILILLWNHFLVTNRSAPAIVRIGAILPLTGLGAEFGKDEEIGAQMAIDEINTSSGTLKFELLVEDSRTQPRDGVAAYQKLMMTTPKPIALLSVMSSVSSAIAPLAERNKVPLFCVAAAPALTQGNRYVFRSLPAANYQTQSLLDLSIEEVKYKTVNILFFLDEFGRTMQASFEAAAKEKGVSVLRSEGISNDTTDFRPALLKLIEPAPEAVFIGTLGSGLSSAIRQLREIGFTGHILAPIELGYQEVLGSVGQSAEGALFVGTQFDATNVDPATQRFVEEFQKRAGRLPTLDAVLAYDEVRMIFDAGSRESFTAEGVHRGLLKTKNFSSLNGPAEMLPNGDIKYQLILKMVEKGKGVPVK